MKTISKMQGTVCNLQDEGESGRRNFSRLADLAAWHVLC